jgi:protein O-GlcNAc transferase
MTNAQNIFADAIASLRSNDFSSAEKSLAKVLKLLPGHLPSLLNLAIAQQAQGKLQDAEKTLKLAIDQYPDNIDAHLLLSRLLLMQRKYRDVLGLYEKILRINPAILEAHCNKAAALNELRRYEDAVASASAALKINPRHLESNLTHGNALFNLGRYEEARAAYRRALEIQPGNAGCLLGLANTLVELRQYDEALAIYGRLLVNIPTFAGALMGRANLFFDVRRYDEALIEYDKALTVQPDLAEAWQGRGNVFAELKRYDEAFAAYDRAFALEPGLRSVEGARLHAKMCRCDWLDFDKENGNLIAAMRAGKENVTLFVMLSVSADAREQLEYTKLWTSKHFPASASPIWKGEIYHNEKIRIGYLSSDFRNHPVAYVMAGVFETHDRAHFETFALSTGRDDGGAMRKRLTRAFDQFIDVTGKNDRDVAAHIKSLNIDILVDLMGHTNGARTPILSQRPAPVQVNYLGYAGTMGASYIDYLIVDRTIVPPSHQSHYAEKVVYLPDSFMPNDAFGRHIPEEPLKRPDFGLPENGFVFCCFQNAYKITPSMFDCWMKILGQVKDSVLWLLEDNSAATANLRKEAAAKGIDPQRLIFAPRLSAPEHLARHRLADLFLDTLPYNAHTTASDTLWAGLPVVTQIGDAFAGRVAASLLNAVGLPELVTQSAEQYEALAIELANSPAKLAAIKAKLDTNRRSAPLFNTELFTRHLERAYAALYERYQAGLAPEPIAVGE